jgi:hypothetical protein
VAIQRHRLKMLAFLTLTCTSRTFINPLILNSIFEGQEGNSLGEDLIKREEVCAHR